MQKCLHSISGIPSPGLSAYGSDMVCEFEEELAELLRDSHVFSPAECFSLLSDPHFSSSLPTDTFYHYITLSDTADSPRSLACGFAFLLRLIPVRMCTSERFVI